MSLPAMRHQELADGSVLVQRRKVIDDWARMENDWSVLRNGQAESFRFRHWLYSAVELRELLSEVGFVNIDVFGSLEGSPYDDRASRLVMRAHRPTTVSPRPEPVGSVKKVCARDPLC